MNPELTPEAELAIVELVRGLEVDWMQMRLTAQISPARRIMTGMAAQAFAMGMLRGTFRQRFPELSMSEINMKVLVYLTPVRMKT